MPQPIPRLLSRSARPPLAVVAAAVLGAAQAQAAPQSPPLLLEELRTMLPYQVPAHLRCLSVGDVDGDGDLDLFGGATPRFSGNEPLHRLYLNDGSGRFRDASAQLPGPILQPLASALVDVDGDGDLDLVLGNGAQPMQLFKNDGSGGFADASASLPLQLDVRGLAAGDLDGDGDGDLLLLTATLEVLLNDGSGAFSAAPQPFPQDGVHTGALALADLDGDGDLDLLRANVLQQGNVLPSVVHLNDGSAGFGPAVPLDEPVDARGVAVGDVDGDGDLDVLLAVGREGVTGYGRSRLHLNDGAGGFTLAPGNTPATARGSAGALLADLDGDGDLDAWIVNADPADPGAQDELLLNDGSGVFTDASDRIPQLLEATRLVAAADLDGDGDLDVLTASPRQVRTMLNDGAANFTETSSSLPPGAGFGSGAAWGDVDGDGHLDVLVTQRDQRNLLWIQRGDGTFEDAGERLPDLFPYRSSAVALGDVDGDGDLDALVGESWITGGTNRLLRNDGAGNFTYAGALPWANNTSGFALGDIDGDGDLDALVAVGPSSISMLARDKLYLNLGGGVFVDASAQLPAPNVGSRAVALGDVDGDGDLDGVALSGPPMLFLNDGTGVFADGSAQLPALPTGASSKALADLDGDGDLDLYVGYPGQDVLLVNDGLGSFSDASALIPQQAIDTSQCAAWDVDGDGDLDLMLASTVVPAGSAPVLRLHLQQGGVFVDATAAVPELQDWVLVLAATDVDGDGDGDLLLVSRGEQSRLLTGLVRQAARRALPRALAPLELEVFGPPGGSWLLLGSLASGVAPFPPYGVLRLDRDQVFHRSAGALDARGRALVREPVVPSPALLGRSLHWQALVGAPLRLTNLETTTFSQL